MKGQPAPRVTSAPPPRSAPPKGSADSRLLMEAAHRLDPSPKDPAPPRPTPTASSLAPPSYAAGVPG